MHTNKQKFAKQDRMNEWATETKREREVEREKEQENKMEQILEFMQILILNGSNVAFTGCLRFSK